MQESALDISQNDNGFAHAPLTKPAEAQQIESASPMSSLRRHTKSTAGLVIGAGLLLNACGEQMKINEAPRVETPVYSYKAPEEEKEQLEFDLVVNRMPDSPGYDLFNATLKFDSVDDAAVDWKTFTVADAVPESYEAHFRIFEIKVDDGTLESQVQIMAAEGYRPADIVELSFLTKYAYLPPNDDIILFAPASQSHAKGTNESVVAAVEQTWTGRTLLTHYGVRGVGGTIFKWRVFVVGVQIDKKK